GDVEVDGDEVDGADRQQLAEVAAAVAVAVAPQHQLGEGRVGAVDAAVAVPVELGEGLEAVAGPQAALEHGAAAEQLAAALDDAVAVAVEGEPGEGGPVGAEALADARDVKAG